LYGLATALGAGVLWLFGRSAGRFRRLPFASGWTRHRDFPAPQGATFQAQWRRRGAEVMRNGISRIPTS